MEPWIAQDGDLGDVCLQIADKSQDPQFVSQIPRGGQHKDTPAAHVWTGPNRELVMGGCFRCLSQSEPAISVAAGPFEAIADEAQTAPLLIGDGSFSLLGDELSGGFAGRVVHARAPLIGTIGLLTQQKAPS